jgi:Spy/CpxP family protein refolding chaperone
MDKAFTNEPVDQAVVRQTADKMAEVKGRMFVEKTEARLALQDILTAEQIDKLQQYRKDDYRKGKQRGNYQKKGRGWGQNQDCPRYSYNSVE